MKSFKKICVASALGASAFVAPDPAMACQTTPIIGSICTVGTNFCTLDTLPADGRLVSIAENEALFALLGTNFGGDGATTFALPDLRGRSVLGVGSSTTSTSQVTIGQTPGAESVTLTLDQLPAHTHAASINASTAIATTNVPTNNVLAKQAQTPAYGGGATLSDMGSSAVILGSAGTGNAPVATRSPGLGLTHCIAVFGIFPSRN